MEIAHPGFIEELLAVLPATLGGLLVATVVLLLLRITRSGAPRLEGLSP